MGKAKVESDSLLGPVSRGAYATARLALRPVRTSSDTLAGMVDWCNCPEVERNPERVGGVRTFRGTRVPVSALFDNLASGSTTAEFLEWFEGVSPDQIDAVLTHVSRSADEDARPLTVTVRRICAEASAIGTPETLPWDAASSLRTREDVVTYLDAALEDGDAATISCALANILRSAGLTRAIVDSGVTRAELRGTVTASGDPGLTTLLMLVRALGLELRVLPVSDAAPDDRPPRAADSPPARGGPDAASSRPVLSRDPEVLGGTAVFGGTRVPVTAAFDYLEAGDTVDGFLDDYPGVSRNQVLGLLKLARPALVGPDERSVSITEDVPAEAMRPARPNRAARRVVYGGRELDAVPANGVGGVLLRSLDGRWCFRVTRRDGTFRDYRVRHDDLKVTIADDELAAFYATGGEEGILDHSPEVLGLRQSAPPSDQDS